MKVTFMPQNRWEKMSSNNYKVKDHHTHYKPWTQTSNLMNGSQFFILILDSHLWSCNTPASLLCRFIMRWMSLQEEPFLTVPLVIFDMMTTWHWKHFLILVEQSSQVRQCPHGWNTTSAGHSKQMAHSPLSSSTCQQNHLLLLSTTSLNYYRTS